MADAPLKGEGGSRPLSMIPGRTRHEDPIADVLSGQLAETYDHGQLIAGLLVVLQHFVRERCDGESIDPKKLEDDWNNLAARFKAHADAINTEVKRGD